MIGSRALWMSVVALVVLAGAVSSCAKNGEPAVAGPSTERGVAPEPTSTPAERPQAACFIQADGVWQPAYAGREAQCFERDSCNGGLGTEKGQCAKWALSAEAPALPWSATLTQPKLAADVPPPKGLYEGSYEMTSDCSEKGCAYASVRYAAATPLYAQQDARSRIVATVPAAECAQQTGKDALLSAPTRGVVLETRGGLDAGDVIYLTAYEGEGYSTIWRRGEYLSLEPDGVVVRWDARPTDPREGYWVEVKRANGQTGWARDPDRAERGCKVGK